jgi:hypothetical protein
VLAPESFEVHQDLARFWDDLMLVLRNAGAEEGFWVGLFCAAALSGPDGGYPSAAAMLAACNQDPLAFGELARRPTKNGFGKAGKPS